MVVFGGGGDWLLGENIKNAINIFFGLPTAFMYTGEKWISNVGAGGGMIEMHNIYPC